MTLTRTNQIYNSSISNSLFLCLGSIKTYWLELKNSRPQKYKIPLRNTNDIPEYGRSAALGKKMSTYAPIMYCDFIPEYAQSTDSNGGKY